mmetsp:Transcript_18021/g.35339  ORF Transcript_18021/g.35339 Transcript_18021/m.35339 type:complete len:80 (-) Transcript_18021:321-560(-)
MLQKRGLHPELPLGGNGQQARYLLSTYNQDAVANPENRHLAHTIVVPSMISGWPGHALQTPTLIVCLCKSMSTPPWLTG